MKLEIPEAKKDEIIVGSFLVKNGKTYAITTLPVKTDKEAIDKFKQLQTSLKRTLEFLKGEK